MGLRGDRAAGEDEAGRPRTLRPPSSTQSAFLQRGPSLREPTLQTLLSPNLSPGAQGSALTATSLAVSLGSHQLSGLGWFILSLPLPLTVQTREREGSGKSTPSSLAANEKRKEGGLTEPPTWERPPHHLPPKGPALPEAPRGRPSLQRRPCSQGRELELVRRRLQADIRPQSAQRMEHLVPRLQGSAVRSTPFDGPVGVLERTDGPTLSPFSPSSPALMGVSPSSALNLCCCYLLLQLKAKKQRQQNGTGSGHYSTQRSSD